MMDSLLALFAAQGLNEFCLHLLLFFIQNYKEFNTYLYVYQNFMMENTVKVGGIANWFLKKQYYLRKSLV